MRYRKTFHCKGCSHSFERLVLETVVTAVCPACKRWVGLLEFAQQQGLTFGQAVVAGLILYAIFG
jgi:prepilin signal peptidase PulO-like enzyme (type II secretory pathway)